MFKNENLKKIESIHRLCGEPSAYLGYPSVCEALPQHPGK